MGSSGRPSTACTSCKIRRIKCDKTEPICNQCTKSDRECSGPSHTLHIRFWSREKTPKGRHWSTKIPGIPQKEGEFGPASSPTSNRAASQSQADPYHKLPLDSRALQMPLQERANAYFIYVYAPTPVNESFAGFTGFAVPLEIKREPKYYQSAFEACALAAFSRDTLGPKFYNHLALAKYVSAVQSVHAALEVPATVYEDTTLASILLLALFECINPTASGVKVWSKHIMGAMSLAQKRIRDQDVKEIGHSLFTAVRTQMVLYSLVTLEGGGNDDIWWPQDDATHKYTFTQKLCVKASSLGAKAKNLLAPPRDEEYARKLLKECLDLDQNCRNWWGYCFANSQDEHAQVDQTVGTTHTGFQLLMLWNMLLYARILLNAIMIRCTACIYEHRRDAYRTSREYSRTVSVLQNLITNNITINNKQREEGLGLGLQWYFKAWPLAFMLSSRCLADDQTTIVSDQLRDIGKHLGIWRSFGAP